MSALNRLRGLALNMARKEGLRAFVVEYLKTAPPSSEAEGIFDAM